MEYFCPNCSANRNTGIGVATTTSSTPVMTSGYVTVSGCNCLDKCQLLGDGIEISIEYQIAANLDRLEDFSADHPARKALLDEICTLYQLLHDGL